MATGKYVSYLRVSTQRQGRSGLGLEAQRKAVRDYLDGGRWELLDEFVEVESGKKSDRPELAKALDACKRHKATLVIAKLDRLARNVHFISGLLESRVKFVCADMPEADRAFLQMAAVFAEWEARKISERTKAAMAAAKQRRQDNGEKLLLGFSHPKHRLKHRAASLKGGKATQDRARQFARNVHPIIEKIRASGITSVRGIAQELNERKVGTARGGKWHPSYVIKVEQAASRD